MIKLVIFDLDGTLVNTIEDLGVSTNQALSQHGYPTHPISAYKQFVGNGADVLIERALPKEARDKATISEVKATFIAYYDAHVADYSLPYEGIMSLLEALHVRGIQCAVATNKPHQQALKVVASCMQAIPFCRITGQQVGKPHKPDPSMVLETIAACGCTLEEVLYVGDSDVDMQTAVNAGVTGIGVTWGFRTADELQAHGASKIVTHPLQILEYIL